jgi:hypothetical protein
MLSGDKDSIGDLVSIISSLNKIKDEPRGVSSHPSVVKDGANKVNPTLNSSETARLKNIADVLGKAWKIGDYAPKPEATRLGDLTPDKQKNLGISAIKDKVTPIQKQEKGNSLLDMLGGLLAAAAGAVMGWSLLPKELKDQIKSKLLEWSKGLGNLIAETLPEILGKMGDWIANHIKDLGPANIVRLTRPFVTLLDKMFDAIEATVRGYARISKALTPSAVPATKNLGQPGSRVVPSKPPTSINVSEEITSRYRDPLTGRYATAPVKEASFLSKGLSATKNFVGKVGGSLPNVSKMLEPVGKFMSSLFKVTKGATKIAKSILKIPFIAELIETGTFLYYKNQQDKQLEEGKISLDERNLRVGSRAMNSTGAILGGLGGAILANGFLAGATIGTGGALAPWAFAIQPAISIGGAFAGDILGRFLANSLSSFSPDFAKAMGSNIGDNMKEKPNVTFGELQDFFVKGNKVYPFNNKDELLSMKTGGAIDNLIKSRPSDTVPESIMAHNKFTKSAYVEQIKRQDTMIELLMQLVRKPVGNSTVINKQQSSVGGSDFRVGFNDQTLAY